MEQLLSGYALNLSIISQADGSLLIRGGSSAVGLVAADYARVHGLIVISTTRDPQKSGLLRRYGVDHVVIETGGISPAARDIRPDGADAMLDLVGTKVLEDSFACVRCGGVLCMAGLLGGEWEIENFVPGAVIPSTTKLTYFSSSATPMTTDALRVYLTGLEDGTYRMPLDRVFKFDEIQEAHAYMEANSAGGKVVITLS